MSLSIKSANAFKVPGGQDRIAQSIANTFEP
jgi:hypothetical protein